MNLIIDYGSLIEYLIKEFNSLLVHIYWYNI